MYYTKDLLRVMLLLKVFKINNMCECEKINTCGTIHLATCVKYEGFIPEDSDLKKECDVTVEEAIEDLYKREKAGSVNIEAGDFLELNNSTLNVLVGNTETTVKRGDWVPTWEDITNKPVFSDINVGEGLVKNEDTISISPNVISDINKGVQSFSWGDHRSEGYLKQIPLATNTEIGGFKLVSNQVQNVLQNSISNVNNRTYSIQLNSLGQGVVNVPWESNNYLAGTGISIGGNVITNISPNATHTGDVTGTVALSIANGVVSNTKLSPMPALTIKGNIGNAGQPQDLTIQQVKDMLGLTESYNRVVFAVGEYSLDLQLYNTTTVFARVEGDITIVIIPPGDFEGQTINFYSNVSKPDAVFLKGSFLITAEDDFSINNFDYTSYNFEHLYWSSDIQKWVVGNIYRQ